MFNQVPLELWWQNVICSVNLLVGLYCTWCIRPTTYSFSCNTPLWCVCMAVKWKTATNSGLIITLILSVNIKRSPTKPLCFRCCIFCLCVLHGVDFAITTWEFNVSGPCKWEIICVWPLVVSFSFFV